MQGVKSVSVREEALVIPTYLVHPPEKSPLFLERRAYQGSTGKVYPFPVTEGITDTRENVSYRAVILENEYLLVMILPELGGRIQRAYDKTNGYDFVYYNHVVKPALVGLTGPWISGGIEFNWPQHHRPSTFDPVEHFLRENEDGSCSVYVSEIDKMHGTKGMARITLYPEKAYIEIQGQLYNPTDFPQSFLWWANPAVPVNEHTYSVFPPDVNAVMDHGKRAVSTFPIATGEYYKYDYSEGVDISRYANIKVPTSYMAAHSDYDFIGNYDERAGAGLLHVADHHISPGKKQWTWGNGDFGRTWDRNLTDADGPYIELMTGVFTDNQPDFTWLKPHEEKTFTQYFMPYKGVGRVGNATHKAIVGLEVSQGGQAALRVYATEAYEDVLIRVALNGSCLYEQRADLSPADCFSDTFELGELRGAPCLVTVTFRDEILVQYQKAPQPLRPIPQPALPLPSPGQLKTTEELYLAALHLQQYRHASFDPEIYYLEGLRRDATDIRLNNGYGLLLLRRGQIEESIPHFRAAIEKQTWKNPNPYHGESYFNLGLALEKSGQTGEAFDAFYKSTWSAETQSSGFYWLACLSARKGQYAQALDFAEKAMLRNWHSMRARALKAMLLRKLGKPRGDLLAENLKIDPLNMASLYETALESGDFAPWQKAMRASAHNHLELSLEYMNAGLYPDALGILDACTDTSPMPLYYKGYAAHMEGDPSRALAWYLKAEQAPPEYCFPNRLEEYRILSDCVSLTGEAPMAEYYMGNLLYDKKRHELAISHWENAVRLKPGLALGHRNLAIAYYNKHQDAPRAVEAMKTACALDPLYPRFALEYDQLSALVGIPVTQRLNTLSGQMDLVDRRDDLYLRHIALLNLTGAHQKALDRLLGRKFHPWEGGEGKVSGEYRHALMGLAKKAIHDKDYPGAIEHLKKSLRYPENFGEGKLPNTPDNQAMYTMGLAYRLMGREDEALHCFAQAVAGDQEPGSALYYNEQPSDYIYYMGLARRALGNEAAAKKAFHKLIAYGERHVFDQVTPDFFAVSLPEINVFQDDLQDRNTAYCNYLRALGLRGLGRDREAEALLEEIIKGQPDHFGALEQLIELKG